MMDAVNRNTPEFSRLIGKMKQAIDDIRIISEKHHPELASERYYTGEEICLLLHLSKRTLQNYRDDGIIPFTKIGDIVGFCIHFTKFTMRNYRLNFILLHHSAILIVRICPVNI